MRSRVLAMIPVAALAFGSTLARAETVKWLHIEQNPEVLAHYEDLVSQFEADNPGVTVEVSYLENQSFKQKLTTMLQSDARPHIFYSWGGGVFDAQAEAGFLRDITDSMEGEWASDYPQAAVDAFTYDGQVYGSPMLTSQVVFWYNKDLMAEAGVDPDAIKSWDDLLVAVQQLKDAGIAPLAAGGADKWPLHFYWTHLAIRLGGREAFEAAINNEGDGFAAEPFIEAGRKMQELVELEPFQDGFLAATNEDASGMFGDGETAMYFMGNWLYNVQRVMSADGEGLPDDNLGFFTFPMIEGGAGEPSDTLGGINGWLVGNGAPDAAVDFLRVLTSKENQTEMAARDFYIPVADGASANMKNPFFKQIAENIAASDYHQIFYDQKLGPAVGLVVNDISADIAAGVMTPEEAAQTVQDAWEFAQ
ncbi:MAG: extracellular solute-binding protein [Pseudomonadota bacterium]